MALNRQHTGRQKFTISKFKVIAAIDTQGANLSYTSKRVGFQTAVIWMAAVELSDESGNNAMLINQ